MKKEKKISPSEENLWKGRKLLGEHPVFGNMQGVVRIVGKEAIGKDNSAIVTSRGDVYANKDKYHTPQEWCHMLAHCKLHLAFGHFDAEKINECMKNDVPGAGGKFNRALWNIACDIYVEKFLADIKFGKAVCQNDFQKYQGAIEDEAKLYEYLVLLGEENQRQLYGTASENVPDMRGLDTPIIYDVKNGESNLYAEAFSRALAEGVKRTVDRVSGIRYGESNPAVEAANWFISHYPLLGALAASFEIIYDSQVCMREEIQIAAVDAENSTIFVNPSANLRKEELKFVLAHEFLHPGLQHHLRCQGRDFFLWNVACDYVVNGGLYEMKVGDMPEGVLFDKGFLNISAEEIYDRLVGDIRKSGKQNTLRGYHQGDMIRRRAGKGSSNGKCRGRSLDDFYREALAQGVVYHQESGRGFLPAGLIEEIRALAMPVIPWDVKLAAWFEEHFELPEKRRSYARPSRRQGATPDIPRPRYVEMEEWKKSRTFGVVLDTSGSMSNRTLGMALGSIASYAAAREIRYARVVFCDAQAYDAGYMTPEDIAGRVQVKGRGGTELQPGINLLEQAKDFPKDGPILLITDGEIEDYLSIKREHAYLMPAGRRLPFRAKGEIFYFEEA